MAINFPDNPSPNAVFTDNGISWKWDGTTWEGISSTTTTTLNDIGDVNVGTTITDGHVLKWDLSSTKWVAGPDLTSSGGSGIALTDISVIKPNPTASGSGDVTYSSTSGAFTYTPPDLSSYLTSYTVTASDLNNLGVGNLGDVSTAGASVNDVLKWDGSNWSPAADAGGITLTNFSVVKPNPSASGGGDVTYDNTTGEFTYTPPSIPAAQVQSDWNASTGLGEILNKPTLPSNLSDLANVSSTAPNNNEVLKWNGSAWAPAADGGGASSADPIGTITIWSGSSSNIPTGYQLCDGSASATTELQAIRTNVPDLRDRFVIGSGSTYGENDTGGSADAVVVEHKHTTSVDNHLLFDGSGSQNISYGGAGGYPAQTFTMNNEGVSGTDKNLPPYYALCYIIKNAATATSGGSTSPGGSDTHVQFNSSGSFAGDASLKWDNTNNRLSIGEDANDSYLEVGKGAPGTGGSRFSIRSNNSSNYLYSYATNMFHISVANASGGGTIQFDSISSTMAQFVRGAECSLYHSGTKRIETTSDGIKISGGIQDKDGELGTAGQILSSTGTELNWIPAPSGGGSGEANVQADWNESSSSSDAYIQNKPTLFSGSYTDLTNQPTIPTNNDQLTNGAGYTTFDGAYGSLTGTPTIPAAQIQTDWTQSNSSSLDFIKNKPTNVSAFTNDAGYITSSSVPSGVPSGTIVMYNGSSAPTGWVICNGSNSTPDLRDKFILAAGSTYSVGDTGGSADAVVVSHSHGSGNYGTNNTGGHTHGQGNLSTNNTGGHAHASGNLSTNNTGSHSHTQSGSGSGSTGNQSANHYHTTSSNITIGGGSHSHNITTAPGDDHNDSIRKTQSGRADSSYYATSTEASSHTHNFNFTQDTLGVSQNHTHDFNFNIGGNTGNDGDHSHNVSGNTATNGDHSHNVSGNTGTNGDHSHTISGNSSSQGSSGTGANLPPYYTLTFIMKT
tara:strand:- start:6441 stop:9308 length:2868 start_codon:yes stop_codon:yes gene_type:complete